MSAATLTEATEPDIDTMKRVNEVAIWSDFRAQAEKLKLTAETLTVTSADQVAEMKLARVTRITLKNLRCEIERKREELVEHHVKTQRKINADAKELKAIIEPLETRLLEQEEFAERELAKQKAETKLMREEEMASFTFAAPWGLTMNLADLSEEDYVKLYQQSKGIHEAEVAARAKAESDRIAKEKADTEERARVIAENIRLKEENAKKEAEAMAARVKAESDRIAAEKKAREEREAIESAARVEREKLETAARIERERAEAERVAAAKKSADVIKAAGEKARKEREAAEAKARVEREAREKVERELADKRAAEQKKLDDALAAQEKAAKAPDRQKIAAYAEAIKALPYPMLMTRDGTEVLSRIVTRSRNS